MSSTASGTNISSVDGEIVVVTVTPSGNFSWFFILNLRIGRVVAGVNSPNGKLIRDRIVDAARVRLLVRSSKLLLRPHYRFVD